MQLLIEMCKSHSTSYYDAVKQEPWNETPFTPHLSVETWQMDLRKWPTPLEHHILVATMEGHSKVYKVRVHLY